VLTRVLLFQSTSCKRVLGPRRAGTTDGATGAALVSRWEKDPDAQRPNLLKKGIILVKAWCYYEARVLGAHHSLLSSYALEVMVLYVLQHYHRRTRTPFALLVTYLQVFSAFDWSTYGLTLHGPIPLSQIGTSLPGVHPRTYLFYYFPHEVLYCYAVGARQSIRSAEKSCLLCVKSIAYI
jgi:hypothetical protein